MVILPSQKRIDWTKPPLVLLALVVLNVLVFVFYQSADTEHVTRSVESYQDRKLLDVEWEPYRDYWQEHIDDEALDDLDESPRQREAFAASMALDQDFYEFLESNIQSYPTIDVAQWRRDRAAVNEALDNISSRRFGLTPKRLDAISLLTHQFLHGGVEHLLGNMVFLIICGFAVEAALGHLRFLLFYLLGGVFGGLLFSGTELALGAGNVSLIGASGAISAVMAMYLALYGLRKIEFFYWVFVFTGYFRAPALVILPLFIGKELSQYFLNDASNIAYTAHMGGFVGGALLIACTKLSHRDGIDTDYLEQEQDIDPYKVDLDKVYRAIGDYRFRQALQDVEKMLVKYAEKPELGAIRLNLISAEGGDALKHFLLKSLQHDHRDAHLLAAQARLWRELQPAEQTAIGEPQQIRLALATVETTDVNLAEQIFAGLVQRGSRDPMMAKLARRLAGSSPGSRDKRAGYARLADQYAAAA
ncbi:MAG: rhomboid family intramembrane serine protease [Gammaproteobacteria bacterium]